MMAAAVQTVLLRISTLLAGIIRKVHILVISL